MQAYNCKDRESAATVGWENLRKLDIGELMETLGLTDKTLVNVVVMGIVRPEKLEKKLLQKLILKLKKLRDLFRRIFLIVLLGTNI